MIEIPFTVINDRSSFEIGAMLDYVRDDGSIKGVVISLNIPGGGAAPSEELYFEIARLREKKPAVGSLWPWPPTTSWPSRLVSWVA